MVDLLVGETPGFLAEALDEFKRPARDATESTRCATMAALMPDHPPADRWRIAALSVGAVVLCSCSWRTSRR
jgi:hypothetical protein